jgi:hypothetical protein
MEVNGEYHSPAAVTLFEKGAGRASAGPAFFGEEKNNLPEPGPESWIIQLLV